MLFAKNVGFLQYENRIIAVNRHNGCWIKYPKSCHSILLRAIELKYEKEKLLSMLADDDDRNYMTELIDKLRNADIIVDNDINKKGIFTDVSLMLTKRCNLQCRHCSVSACTMHEKEYFSTYEMKRIFDKIIGCAPSQIVLTGGEPLVRKDFIELLQYLFAHYNGRISLMTNGTLIDRKMAEILAPILSNIDISIDGVDEETCSVIRGKGVFNKVIDTIKLLQDTGISKISLSMVSTPQNELFEEAFIDLCSKLKVKPMIRKYDVLGRAKENEDILNAIKGKYKDRKPRKIEQRPVEEEIGCTCQGGYSSIFIRYDGNVFPCPMLEKENFTICNITKVSSLHDYCASVDYASHPAYISLSKIDPVKADECKDCPVSLFCWSCPYYLLQAQKDPAYFEQHCWPQKYNLMKRIWGVTLSDNKAMKGKTNEHNNMDNK